MIVIVIILESANYPEYQTLIVGAGVSAAFGLPGLLIAVSTISGWKGSWYVLDIPQMEEEQYTSIIDSPVDDSEYLGADRWEKVVPLAKAHNFEGIPMFEGTGDVYYYKIRSNGRLRQRVDFGYGVVFNDGMPVINSHVEKLNLAPLFPDPSLIGGKVISLPTFELISTRSGDYKMFTDPEISKLIWETWTAKQKKIEEAETAKTEEPSAPVPQGGSTA